MLDLRLQIADAAAREGRRAFALPDGARIQTFSALALLFIQNAAVLPGLRSDRPWSRMGGEASPAGALGSLPHPFRGAVTECASQLLRSLVSCCIERSDDTEAKALLDEFVRDMLLVLGRPEWPAAALLVTLLSTILCRRLEKKKLHRTPSDKLDAKGDKDELAARLFSLDLLGQILAALAAQRRMHAEAPLLFPADKEEVDVAAQPNDAGEDARCVCGHGYDGSFMLDCDKCHRWFHGECVGVKPNDDNIAREWYCDSCQLSRAVADQRRTITRLLSLADCGGEDGTQGSAAASEEAVNALCTEEEVTKQLLLNYLDAASSNPASSAAHRSLLCQWHFDAAERKEFVLCRLYEEQDAAHTERCRGPRELHSGRDPLGDAQAAGRLAAARSPRDDDRVCAARAQGAIAVGPHKGHQGHLGRRGRRPVHSRDGRGQAGGPPRAVRAVDRRARGHARPRRPVHPVAAGIRAPVLRAHRAAAGGRRHLGAQACRPDPARALPQGPLVQARRRRVPPADGARVRRGRGAEAGSAGLLRALVHAPCRWGRAYPRRERRALCPLGQRCRRGDSSVERLAAPAAAQVAHAARRREGGEGVHQHAAREFAARRTTHRGELTGHVCIPSMSPSSGSPLWPTAYPFSD
eukprot:scaffold28390_cov109-Isochrysis_galbana.AAC.4